MLLLNIIIIIHILTTSLLPFNVSRLISIFYTYLRSLSRVTFFLFNGKEINEIVIENYRQRRPRPSFTRQTKDCRSAVLRKKPLVG